MRTFKCNAMFGYLHSRDGDEDAQPTWTFGFDIHRADDEDDLLNTEMIWKALTLLEWKK